MVLIHVLQALASVEPIVTEGGGLGKGYAANACAWLRLRLGLKNVKLQQNMKNVFQKPKEQKRERGERGEESKDSKEREVSKKTRQVLIHPLTPDRPPQAAPC